MAASYQHTRGPASQKFQRRSATGQAQAQRQAFGRTWGAFNSATAKRLRSKGRAS